ncbi:MAG: GFA family protein [Woeseiaceae bacterium]
MIHEGGCLCGAVRYISTAEPLDVGYCHCRMCQKLSGATVLPWASFATDNFGYSSGSPQIYKSSAHGQREFCGNCGSQIAFRATDSDATVEINVGTLDDPESVSPEYHVWCDSRVSWFEVVDDLPRHPKSGPSEHET